LVLADRWDAEKFNANNKINKSSMVFSTYHREGALSQVLSVLSYYHNNLTKIQSIPIIGHEWEYLFFVDLTFEDRLKYKQSLEAIRPLTSNLKILGEYPVGRQML
jgi:prephenate dehydratase